MDDRDDRSPDRDARAQARMEELAVEVALDPGGSAFPALADAYRRAGRLQEARRVAEAGLARNPERVEGRVALALTLLDQGEAEAGRSELGRVLAADPNALSAGPIGFDEASATPVAPEPQAHPEPEPEAAPECATELEPEPATAHEIEEAVPPAAPTVLEAADEEIELAFADAESDPDEMVDATRVAQQAMRAGDLFEPEGSFTPALHPDFATQTMADLLEEQGDTAGAAQVRQALHGVPRIEADAASEPPPESGPQDVVPEIAAPIAVAEPPVPASPEEPVEPASVQIEAALATKRERARRERIVRTLESWLQNIRSEVA